jgi:predicted TIM-barrel fold metal-dependent hydrolase
VGFIEAGAQWLVWVLEGVVRLADHGARKSAMRELLAKKRVWVACEYEDHLPYLAEHAGEDNLIIGTDYGHTDPFSNVRALQTFANRTDISESIKKKIIRDNALAFYGIQANEIPARDGWRAEEPSRAAAQA